GVVPVDFHGGTLFVDGASRTVTSPGALLGSVQVPAPKPTPVKTVKPKAQTSSSAAAAAVPVPVGATATASGHELYVLGGKSSSAVLSGTTLKSLHEVASLPSARSAAVAFSFGAQHAVYLIGGERGGVPLNDIVKVDTKTHAVSDAGPFTEPFAEGVAITNGNAHYIVGGWNGTKDASGVLEFSGPGQVSLVTRLPIAVRAPAATLLGNKIYVAGGESGGKTVGAIQVVDLKTGTARVIGSLPQGVSHATLVVVKGKLFLLGGVTGTATGARTTASARAQHPLAWVVSIDPNTGHAKIVGHLGGPLIDAVIVTVDRQLLAVDTSSGSAFQLAGSASSDNPLQGPPGPAGPAGPAGPQGPAGEKGDRGPAGPAGANGAAGPVGPAGPAGAAGPAGPAGANGSNGSNGSKGATGAAGTSGSNGAKGATGAQGPTGARGPTGTAGSNAFATNPSSTQTVVYGGTAVQTILKMAASASAAPFDIQDSTGASKFTIGTGGLVTTASVNSASIVDGSIADADVSASAAIAGTKISPNFGSQNITTSGNISSTGSGTITSAGALTVSSGGASITGPLTSVTTGAFSGTVTLSDNPSSSGDASVLALSGAPAGSATKSMLSLGSAISGGSASGTYISVNSGSFSGDFLNLEKSNASKFSVSNTGAVTAADALTVSANGASITGPLTSVTTGAFSGTVTLSDNPSSSGDAKVLALTGTPASTSAAAKSMVALGSAIQNGSTGANNGTYVGIGAVAGFTGDFAHFEDSAGNVKFKVSGSGAVTEADALTVSANGASITGPLTSVTTGAFSGTVTLSDNPS
ncbi:MAG: hypothetical protein JO017_01735, partial [Actinobacteria bacterium]|nr:hypothetical protein [Actinomycetota bacterium]